MLGCLCMWGGGGGNCFISDLAMGQREQRYLGKDDGFEHQPTIMGIVTLRISYYPQIRKACLRGVKNSTLKKKIRALIFLLQHRW